MNDEIAESPDGFEYGKGVPMVVNPSLPVFDMITKDLRYKGQLIARNQKLDSGVGIAYKGIILGFIFAVIMIGLPIIMGGI